MRQAVRWREEKVADEKEKVVEGGQVGDSKRVGRGKWEVEGG